MQHDHVTLHLRHATAGLIGRGIAGSRTPAMHMAEGRALGITYDYLRFDMDDRQDSLAEVLEYAADNGFAGVNVTFPYKVEVIAHLDVLSANARALGAVNTVVFKEGRRYGHNTDLWGFAESFRRNMVGASTRKVLLIGAGGAGMAVAHAMLSLGAETLWIFDCDTPRSTDLAASLAARFGDGHVRIAAQISEVPGDLCGVINASPVGMDKLPGCPFPKAMLRPDLWVADVVYVPLETELLAAARAVGCRVLPGSGMAVFQAVRAFELITGLVPDPARLRATFQSLGP